MVLSSSVVAVCYYWEVCHVMWRAGFGVRIGRVDRSSVRNRFENPETESKQKERKEKEKKRKKGKN